MYSDIFSHTDKYNRMGLSNIFQFMKVAFILANCAAGYTLFTKLPLLAERICINFEVNHAFNDKKA